jgi:hypothetical protein
MRTSDQGNRYEKFFNPRNEHKTKKGVDEFDDFNQDLNEERIMSTYRPKEKTFYYDNAHISMSYGQYNLEKCLLVLLIIIIYSACLVYEYFNFFPRVDYYLILVGGGLDVITSFSYLYFLLKLKSQQIFNKIPSVMSNASDVLILINFFVKVVTIVKISVDFYIFAWTGVILFSLKFLFELYFSIISVKLFMFCPCTMYFQEQSEKTWIWIKYYIFCCEVEESGNPDYTKIEDLESFY